MASYEWGNDQPCGITRLDGTGRIRGFVHRTARTTARSSTSDLTSQLLLPKLVLLSASGMSRRRCTHLLLRFVPKDLPGKLLRIPVHLYITALSVTPLWSVCRSVNVGEWGHD